MNWTLALDYLRVIVWPSLAVALVIIFRRPLHALVGRVRKAGAAGVEVEFDQAEEVLRRADEALVAGQQEIDAVLPSEVGKAQNAESDDSSSADPSPGRAYLEGREKLTEKARRSSIEEVLAEGVRLGWEYARYGEERPPRFEVMWDESGYPQIRNTSTEAAARVLASRAYKDDVFSAISRAVVHASSADSLTRTTGDAYDFVFDSDGGGLTWVVVDPFLTSADRIHRVHEAFSFRTKFRAKDTKLLLGVVFVHRSRLAPRVEKIIQMLWADEQADMVRIVRWVDSSDNGELPEAFSAIDDSIPPF